jgi:hypothetical protein
LVTASILLLTTGCSKGNEQASSEPTASPPAQIISSSPTPDSTPTPESTPTPDPTPTASTQPKTKKSKSVATPSATPTPTKKPPTPVKYGNTIPENEVFPFPVVGKQIDEGYYYNSKGPCGIVVFDSKGNDIYTEQSNSGGQVIINLKNGDYLQNYCSLTKGLPPVYKGSSIPTGMHIINGDLLPGTYTTSKNCSYWVSKGNSAPEYTRGVSANIEQSYTSNAGIPFTLGNINEAVYFHNSCGVINKIG